VYGCARGSRRASGLAPPCKIPSVRVTYTVWRILQGVGGDGRVSATTRPGGVPHAYHARVDRQHATVLPGDPQAYRMHATGRWVCVQASTTTQWGFCLCKGEAKSGPDWLVAHTEHMGGYCRVLTAHSTLRWHAYSQLGALDTQNQQLNSNSYI
jgi:hypothetical protein